MGTRNRDQARIGLGVGAVAGHAGFTWNSGPVRAGEEHVHRGLALVAGRTVPGRPGRDQRTQSPAEAPPTLAHGLPFGSSPTGAAPRSAISRAASRYDR